MGALGQRPHPHRLGSEPKRHAPSPPQKVLGVGVEGVEIDNRERRIKPFCGGV
jgi:hypothetical protein